MAAAAARDGLGGACVRVAVESVRSRRDGVAMASIALCRGWIVGRMKYPPPTLYPVALVMLEESSLGLGGGGGAAPETPARLIEPEISN